MSWRGLVAVVTLLAAGIAGGFVMADQLRSTPATSGAPEPVVASDPSIPVDPSATLRDDPPQPPLGSDLPMRDVSVGTDAYKFIFPAPRGWTRIDTVSNEVKYKMANYPTNTYLLRVEQVTSDHETIPDSVASRIEDLERDEQQVNITKRTYDTIEFNYVHDGYKRYGIITWKDLTGSQQAEAEVALTGRSVDVPGMEDLWAKLVLDRENGIRAG